MQYELLPLAAPQRRTLVRLVVHSITQLKENMWNFNIKILPANQFMINTMQKKIQLRYHQDNITNNINSALKIASDLFTYTGTRY